MKMVAAMQTWSDTVRGGAAPGVGEWRRQQRQQALPHLVGNKRSAKLVMAGEDTQLQTGCWYRSQTATIRS